MNTLILGKGYCGAYLHSILPKSTCAELPKNCQVNDFPFDFNDQSTWALPDFSECIITFKMENLENAQALANILKGKKIIILSSARCFKNSHANETINENSKLNNSKRSLCESLFLPDATILHLGLIWGPDREPLRWISEGRIKNGLKAINLIHQRDIGNIVKEAISSEHKGRLLVSDGEPKQWRELANLTNLRLPESQTGLESRIFDTKKLQLFLPDNYSFQNYCATLA
jgi:nucleoside-diphosphate-sugar epimerase